MVLSAASRLGLSSSKGTSTVSLARVGLKVSTALFTGGTPQSSGSHRAVIGQSSGSRLRSSGGHAGTGPARGTTVAGGDASGARTAGPSPPAPAEPHLSRGGDVVGATGLEPAISCSQSRRASHYATPRSAAPVLGSARSPGESTGPSRGSVIAGRDDPAWPTGVRLVGCLHAVAPWCRPPPDTGPAARPAVRTRM